VRPAAEQRPLPTGLLRPGVHCDQCRYRREHQGDQGEPPIKAEHDGAGDAEKDQRRQDIEQDQAYRAGKPLDAAVEPRHDRADAFAALHSQRHLVKLAYRRLEQRVLQANTRTPGQPVCRSVQTLAQECQAAQSNDTQHQNFCAMACQLIEHRLDDERLDSIERGNSKMSARMMPIACFCGSENRTAWYNRLGLLGDNCPANNVPCE
jgi:hypothetical protein